jgi:hypothetical protein
VFPILKPNVHYLYNQIKFHGFSKKGEEGFEYESQEQLKQQ